MRYKYLILGGGIAGVTAAETIRERDPNGSIGIMAQEPHLLYSRVLLPQYIKNQVSREQVFLRAASDFETKNIILLLGKKAVFFDPQKREVKSLEDETYSFEKLLIASGGAPRPLGISGEEKSGIFRLQTIDDADRIRKAAAVAKKAIIVGDGSIALEFLEIAKHYNIPVTLICRNQWFFGNALDAAGGSILEENFSRNGIALSYNNAITGFFGSDRVTGVATRIGTQYPCDFIGIGVGLQQSDQFLLGSGISAGPGRGARTNEFLETSVYGIFAAGDIAEFVDMTIGRSHSHGNWTNAFLQGKIAGENMVGEARIPFYKVPTYSITSFNFHITFLGWTEKDENTVTISRVDVPGKRYARFFLENDILKGAALINMSRDKPALAALIEKRILIRDAASKLSDMDFPIGNLLPTANEFGE